MKPGASGGTAGDGANQPLSRNRNARYPCTICGKPFAHRDVVPGDAISDRVVQVIQRERPEWSRDGYVCRPDLARYRSQYVHGILESEKGELTALEQEVVTSLREHELLSTNVDAEFAQSSSRGERLADRIASFGGSWPFLIIFAVFLGVWIAINSAVLLWRPVDPYPFILLNLVLSCLAAVQAPIIMMSQNRQEAKDRLRSEHDYQVNLKAELEIRHLHEKLDHLLSHQWERLVEIQEIQLELLAELGKR
jgi:uncharacterized membrane protein